MSLTVSQQTIFQSYQNAWVKVQNFQNHELKKFKYQNLQDAYKINNYKFKGLIVFSCLKTNQRSYYNLPNLGF